MNTARQLEELFYAKIPVTRALGVRVEEYDGRRLVLTAPLRENVNHLGTAFGGSINALAVLSGYGLLWLELRDTQCHIVIRESAIHYDRPVRGDLRAVCVRPGEEAVEAFKHQYRQRGKARIVLEATVEDGGATAVRFRGTFVAMR
ncbi:MAG TPA: YiiD C-terminal domain-containing protein [Pyrinomonadaceae bacterium]